MALLRPSELARAWKVHPRTVYLLIREGKLPSVRTPGSHYRVRSEQAREFCAKRGLALPDALLAPQTSIVAIGRRGAASRELERRCNALGVSFALQTKPFEGLLRAVEDPPLLLAIDARCGLPLPEALEALRATKKANGLRVVVYEAEGKDRLRVKDWAVALAPSTSKETARLILQTLDS